MSGSTDSFVLKKIAKGRVAVCIDAANIFYSEQTLGWRIDYQRLAQYLRGQVPIVSLQYYTGVVMENEKQKSFLRKLESFGYGVVSKHIKYIRQTADTTLLKGNLDVELALDAYIGHKDFDTLVLFSGDSDFAYLLDVLKREKKDVIVISTRGHISKELLVRAKYVALPKLREHIERV